MTSPIVKTPKWKTLAARTASAPAATASQKCSGDPAPPLATSGRCVLARTAAIYPDHVSTVYEGRSFTWAQTYGRCRRFASWLAGRARNFTSVSSARSRAALR